MIAAGYESYVGFRRYVKARPYATLDSGSRIVPALWENLQHSHALRGIAAPLAGSTDEERQQAAEAQGAAEREQAASEPTRRGPR